MAWKTFVNCRGTFIAERTLRWHQAAPATDKEIAPDEANWYPA